LPVRKPNRLPSQAVSILDKWFEENVDRPYASEEEVAERCQYTGLKRKQVRTWLNNARQRRLGKQ
jgi:hypothetical protein